MKIVIFGGRGYLGINLSKKLQNQGHNVRIVSNNKFNKSKKKSSFNYTKENFEVFIKKYNPDLIFYFSGNSNPNTSKNHTYDLIRSNLPLQNFLEAMKTIKFKGKIFYSSSIAVYGNLKSKTRISEKFYEPANFYGLSKLISEKQLEFYFNNFGLDITILRLASFFGPNLKKQFIYEFTRKALYKKTIKLKGNREDKRDLLTIDYLVEIISKLIKNKKIKYRIINIGSGNQIKIISIIDKINKILNFKNKIIFENNLKSPEFPLMNLNKLKKTVSIKNLNNNFDKILFKTVSTIKKNGKN